MKIGKDTIYAIHEDDITKFLDKQGLREDMFIGKIKCPVCNKIVKIGNLGGIYIKQQKIFFICDSPHCISIWSEGKR